MIAIVTSTIFPLAATKHTQYRETISSSDRLDQTKQTIVSLKEHGFEKIYLFDNSGFQWGEGTEALLYPAEILKFNTFQFENKGLSELYMLLCGLVNIPENIPIFKISGRYTLNQKINNSLIFEYNFIGKFFDKDKTISTRGYYFQDKQTMYRVLHLALNYVYAYPSKVVGPGSLLRIIQNAFNPNLEKKFYESSISIERGIYKAIKECKLSTLQLEELNISGISGNPEDNLKLIYD
jgi:hypothetical protein